MIYLSLVLNFIFGWLGWRIARRQKRNPWLGFGLGVILGIWGILILLFVPKGFFTFSINKAPAKKQPILTQKENRFFREEKHKSYFWYYLNENQEYQGAFSFQRLEELYTAKKIAASTYVWNESFSSWKTLKELMETSTNLI